MSCVRPFDGAQGERIGADGFGVLRASGVLRKALRQAPEGLRGNGLGSSAFGEVGPNLKGLAGGITHCPSGFPLTPRFPLARECGNDDTGGARRVIEFAHS